MHIVAVLALDQVVPFDLATPIEVFSRTLLPGGDAAYEVRICGPASRAGRGDVHAAAAVGPAGPGGRGHDHRAGPGANPPVPRDGGRGAARGGGAGHADRVDLLGRVRAGRDGSAGRPPRDDPLGGRAGAGPAAPGGRRRPGRAVRRQRADPEFRGRGGGAGPVPAPDPPRPRLGGGGVGGPAVGDAVGTRRRPGPVHRARPAADAARVGAGAGAGVAGGELRGGADAVGRRGPGGDEHPDAEPPVPRADGNDTAAVAAAGPGAAGAVPAGGDGRAVDRIAGVVGFGSPGAFRERFKRVVGTSPQAYRASFRAE